MTDITKQINWIVENWEKIPAEFKTNLKDHYGSEHGQNVEGVQHEYHEVVLLLDRQKPSVEADYSFDEERISVNKEGKVIWGFDSGCSCPSPWHDSYPNCYSCSKNWKQFTLNIEKFDHGAIEEIIKRIDEIKSKTEALKHTKTIEIEKMLFGDYRVQVWDENLNSMLDREYFCRGYASALLTATELRDSISDFNMLPIYHREIDKLTLIK